MQRAVSVWLVLALASVGALAQSRGNLDVNSFPAEMREDVEDIAAGYRLYPEDASVLYQVAAIHARAGHKQQALDALKKMAAVGAGLDPRPRNFASLVNDPEFKGIVAGIHRANPPVLHARLAYVIGEGDLMPEGVAYSEKTRKLYFGGKRKIVSLSEDGKYEELVAPATGGLGNPVGIRVDDQRGELWVVSNAIGTKTPDMVLGLFRFRLADGQLVKAYPIPSADKELLNDVAVAKDGSAYATASVSGALYKADAETGLVEKFLPDHSLPDPNGIAASADGKYLLVAGWYGITRVSLRDRKTLLLTKPTNVADGCLDGMYLYQKYEIVGVQNCNHASGRIMRYELIPDLSRITSAKVLESYNDMFDGITTAAIAGDKLYFMANTQFRKMGKDGKPTEPFEPIKILRLDLK